MARVQWGLFWSVVLLGIVGCGDDDDTSYAFTVTPNPIQLTVGERIRLEVSDVNGATRDFSLSFESADSSIAFVDDEGYVDGRAQGTTSITIIDANTGVSAEVEANVSQPAQPTVSSLAIGRATAVLGVGHSAALTATATYDDGTMADVTNETSWSSQDQTIARVGASTGIVEGIGPGVVVITAQFGGLTQTTMVTVASNAPQLIAVQVTPPAAQISVGGTAPFTAVALYTDGSMRSVTQEATWASSNDNVAQIDATGVAIGLGPGTATLSATFEGKVATAGLVVATVRSLTHLNVLATTTSMEVGQTLQMTAIATWSDGATQDVTTSAMWASSASAVATVDSHSGLVTASSPGRVFINATVGTQMGSVELVVEDIVVMEPVPTLSVTPASASVTSGASVQLTAQAMWPDGGVQDVTTQSSWTTLDSGVVYVDEGTGLVQALDAGLESVTATWSGQVATATITVTTPVPVPPQLVSLEVSPPSVTLAIGQTRQITATASYSDGSSADVTAQVTWTSSSPSDVSVSAGLVSAIAAGSATVTATSGSGGNAVSDSTTVVVPPAPRTPTSVEVTPNAVTVAAGLTTSSFQLLVHYSDGSTETAAMPTWSTADSGVATVNSAGVVTAMNPGGTVLTGSAFGLDATAAVTVTAEVLNQIVVSSSANSIPNGLSATLSATGHFSTGARDVTAHVVFQAAPSNVFSVSGSTVTANAMGAFPQSAAITAAYLGVTSAPLALVATSPLLVSLAISPTSPSTLAVGASRAYTALATYSDGSTQDVTSGAVWNSTAPSVLTVNANGLATGASEGSALLSADYQGVHATPLTIVVDRVPTAVYVNCTTPGYPGDPMDPSTLGGLRCLPSAYGYQVMCTASAYYAGVGSTDVTATAVFSSTNGTVATVSSLGTQNGLPVRWISVVGVGTSAIQATYQGVTSTSGGALGSASWVLEGGDVELSFLGVGTLGTPNTTVGQVIDFYVMGLFLGQPPCDLPYSRDMFRQATWTSSNQAVAGDPVMGRMTAVGPGTTTIDAIIGTMWGDIISTVSP